MIKVANFEIFYSQFINELCEVVKDLPNFAKDPTNLIPMYEHMVLVRTFDTKAIALQRTGKMGTYASTLGQEAIATAVGDAMKTEDVLCPYYREYAAQLQRGVTMADLYRYWGGDERGSGFKSDSHQVFYYCRLCP